MATRGRKPTPDALKKLKGYAVPAKLRGEGFHVKKLATMPKPPSFLDCTAVDEWNRICGVLIPLGILTEADTTILAHLCALHSRVVQASSEGIQIPASALAQLRQYYSEFGLTPVSRGRLRHGQSDLETNPFSANGTGIN